MRTIILFAVGLFFTNTIQAQIGSSISSDGTPPNTNAMLDVQSPATGDGKGILIPRVSQNQRTNANASLAGGLLDGSGNLRGGAAQGLIVYQTDGSQGLYFNTSQTATPVWVYLGNSTTNYLPLTGGTMSGVLNMGAQIVSNVAHIDFSGTDVSVGRGAIGTNYGAAVGYSATGSTYGAAVGYQANGYNNGAAVGRSANGYYGAAVGSQANGYNNGAAVGQLANAYWYGAAVGYFANGSSQGVAMGRQANGSSFGAALGYFAKGTNYGAALGREANGSDDGAAMGYSAVGNNNGAAVGYQANGSTWGAAVGREANGYFAGAALGWETKGTNYGAAVGDAANGSDRGVAVGTSAKGYDFGVAVGFVANGAQTNVAIGVRANAQGGTQRIAIGNNVTNQLDNTAVIRGHIYLDGGTGLFYRANFGSGDPWTAKAFEIDHPLDPANKILRHYCLEGPQVWNVYAGNAQLVNGQAVVQLPDYYSALNLVGSEIYGLTVVDENTNEFPLVKVVKQVTDNRFVIAGTVDMKVSWTIKVLRNDPGCLEDLRRRPVEQLKSEIR